LIINDFIIDLPVFIILLETVITIEQVITNINYSSAPVKIRALTRLTIKNPHVFTNHWAIANRAQITAGIKNTFC